MRGYGRGTVGEGQIILIPILYSPTRTVHGKWRNEATGDIWALSSLMVTNGVSSGLTIDQSIPSVRPSFGTSVIIKAGRYPLLDVPGRPVVPNDTVRLR